MELPLTVFGVERRSHAPVRQPVEFRFEFGVEPVDVIDVDVDVLLAAPVAEFALA